MTKICDFPNPVNDLTKSLIPIYGRCGWQCCSIQNLWMAVVDGVMDNDERVASSKKNILLTLKTRVQKPYPIYGQNDNINTLFINKTGWKTIAFGSALVSLATVFSLVTQRVTRLKTAARETKSAHVLWDVASCSPSSFKAFTRAFTANWFPKRTAQSHDYKRLTAAKYWGPGTRQGFILWYWRTALCAWLMWNWMLPIYRVQECKRMWLASTCNALITL